VITTNNFDRDNLSVNNLKKKNSQDVVVSYMTSQIIYVLVK